MSNTGPSDIKILLVQFTEDDAMRDQERETFIRVGGFGDHQIVALDARGEPLGDHALDGYDAVIVADSIDRSPLGEFQERDGLIALFAAAKARQLPSLGVGFGALMMALSYGGTVVHDGGTEEYGTVTAERLRSGEKDAWFGHLPARFMVQIAHSMHVNKLPWGAFILASTDRCPVLAFGMKEHPAYGLLFHPELDAATLASYLERRAAADPDRAAIIRGAMANIRDASEAEGLLRDWVRNVVLRNAYA